MFLSIHLAFQISIVDLTSLKIENFNRHFAIVRLPSVVDGSQYDKRLTSPLIDFFYTLFSDVEGFHSKLTVSSPYDYTTMKPENPLKM